MSHDLWMSQPVTYRQHLTELVLDTGVPWRVAVEVVSSLLLHKSYDDAHRTMTRQQWQDFDQSEGRQEPRHDDVSGL